MITVYTDGACRVSNPGLCSCAYVVYDDDRIIFEWSKALPGLNTNNFAEYTGVLNALMYLAEHKIKSAMIYCDSKLVVSQVNDDWDCYSEELKPLLNRSIILLLRGNHTIKHIDGHAGHVGNERADLLCNRELDFVQSVVPWYPGGCLAGGSVHSKDNAS
jgi:ribonuclease HI